MEIRKLKQEAEQELRWSMAAASVNMKISDRIASEHDDADDDDDDDDAKYTPRW